EEVPAAEFILEELRRDLPRPSPRPSPPPSPTSVLDRLGPPARMFFAPLEPFLVDDSPEHAHRRRIARAALQPAWQWICRDLMPADAKASCDQTARVLLTTDRGTSERLARAFQDQVVERIRDAVADVQNDAKARQRLAAQVGTPRAIEHLGEIV